jgi:hypothetical protein
MKGVAATASVVFAFGVAACSGRETATTAAAAPQAPVVSAERETSPQPGRPPVHIEMRNVRLRVDDGIALDVGQLAGLMISRSADRPPIFDDQRSYVLQLESATISMDMASLEALLNRHVFAYEGAPLKDVAVRTDGDRIVMKGKLRKGVDVPFSTKAQVSTAGGGEMRLHVESMKAAGVPAKGILDLFGLELDDLVSLRERKGVKVEGDDILIAPGQVLPPPEIRGRLTRIAVSADRLVQTFGDPAAVSKPRVHPSPSARNYIYFGGGDIRFGKLTMHDADLQLIDADPRDPFDFFPARYERQLVAGYSKNTPARGLKTYMPDYGDLSVSGTKDSKGSGGSKGSASSKGSGGSKGSGVNPLASPPSTPRAGRRSSS